MAGLVILAIMIGYLLISVIVVMVTVKTAKKHGRRGWVWGCVAALVMYNLVFWDWIPTIAMHKYKCATEAGFWVCKSREEWIKENPGVFETLVYSNGGDRDVYIGDTDNFTHTYFINNRFRSIVKFSGPHSLNLWRYEQEFVDVKPGEVLAKYVDFASSQIRPTGSWQGWKFWLYSPRCARAELNESSIRGFEKALRGESEK